MTRTERQAARLALGKDAVMTPAFAAELMPFSDFAARTWLRDHNLIRQDPALGDYVIWGEVLAVLRRESDRHADAAPAPKPVPGKLPRKSLRRG